jgi:peptidoglycan hydrolase-like protein with peptidoglycan-binding domain
MKPPYRDINLWRGNSETLTFRLRDASGVAYDLTGDVLKMFIESDEVVTEIVATVTDALVGEFQVHITSAITKTITAKTHQANYEIVRFFEAEEKTVLHGNLLMAGSINHG